MDRHLFKLEPDYRERVWGGPRLTAAAVAAAGSSASALDEAQSGPVIGEAWLAFEGSRIAAGPETGRTLSELLAEQGQRLLGSAAWGRSRSRLPILIKILDTADWLSVQVHPNDEQARRMVGPDEFGKTEAWYVLDAEPGAKLLAGVRPGTTREAIVEAIRGGNVLDVTSEIRVAERDAVLIPAGMLHALGPGLLVYEVQQHSDTTYRAWDWGRPQAGARKLHVDECAAVVEPYEASADPGRTAPSESCVTQVLASPYFCVASITIANGEPVHAETGGSFEVLTAVDGAAELHAGEESVRLAPFETVFVAADTGAYEVTAASHASLLRSGLPPDAS